MSKAVDILKELLQDEPQGYYTGPSELVPVDGYRKAILQFEISSLGPVDAKIIEQDAAYHGWRVLKCQYTTPYPDVPMMQGYDNYVAYVRPDAIPMSLQSLKDATDAWNLVVGKSKVSLAENSVLDALWLSKDAAGGVIGEDPKINVGVDIPVKEIVVGGTVLLGIGFLLFRKKGKR